MRTLDLDRATRGLLAPCCDACTWWQRPDRRCTVDRAAWEHAVEFEVGLFGKVLLDQERLAFSVTAPEGHFFLSLEGALHHWDWLKGMKRRFLEKKDELKAICLDYRRDGDWLKGRGKEQTGRKQPLN